MTKLKAFGAHMGISFIIFLIILYFMLAHWYPFPFFSTDGGWKGIRIVLFVDIVLGPFLTLIVYKKGKRYLALDLTVIGMIQAAALSWGIWVVHHERPAAAVLVEDYFTTVTHYQLGNRLKPGELLRYSKHIPAMIFLNIPEKELQAARLRSLQGQILMTEFTEYYTAIDHSSLPLILQHVFALSDYVADKPQAKRIYDQFVAAHRSEMNTIAFFEWHGRTRWGYLAVDKNNFEVIDFLPIQPLPVEKKKIKM
ncbi:MAG: hypothetical protein HY080_13725 [Gammaproteobacteria bacterium]|nr:hypothetical protein [Gammaproteobacteria bacterium]